MGARQGARVLDALLVPASPRGPDAGQRPPEDRLPDAGLPVGVFPAAARAGRRGRRLPAAGPAPSVHRRGRVLAAANPPATPSPATPRPFPKPPARPY